MNNEEYVRQEGNVCPFCESTNIVGQSVTFHPGNVVQEIFCQTCNAEWEDSYRLMGFKPFSDGSGTPLDVDPDWQTAAPFGDGAYYLTAKPTDGSENLVVTWDVGRRPEGFYTTVVGLTGGIAHNDDGPHATEKLAILAGANLAAEIMAAQESKNWEWDQEIYNETGEDLNA